MPEVIGELVAPSEFIAPNKPAASLPAAPRKGTVYYDTTNNKLVVWTGAGYETVPSA
jgi:hypothetical protein